MDKCNHFWVARVDGYEEQCGPAICLICGEYACECEFRKQLNLLPESLKDRRRAIFKDFGFGGDNHKLEQALKGD